MSLKDTAARTAILTTLYDAIGDELKAAKAELQADLKAAKTETGTKQISAELPDGTEVAKVTLVTPDAAATVTDEQAFLDWVRDHHPAGSDNIVRRFVTEIRPAFVKALLAEMTAAGAPRWCDKETGEVYEVPGVTMQGRAAYHRVTFAKTGREQIGDAWRAGQLRDITLPQLTTGGTE